uniref:RagB/SusD family nutrient uptake outer membrane protein n=1 Tax=uncultured Draconibacterium sp. TaxID=1573823 RepID=UPI0032176DF3
MKNIKYIILLLLVSLMSCEDFLTEKPIDRFTEESYFVDASAARGATVGVYSYLTGAQYYKRAALIVYEYTSDHFYRSNAYKRYDQGAIAPNENWIGWMWSSMYNINGKANTAIENIQKMENISEEERTLYLGYLKFIRAFNLFNAVRTFGDVPLVTETPKIEEDLYHGRTPKDQVYQFIIDELKACIDNNLLPLKSEQPTGDYGFPTLGAARGILAKVYLTLGDWDNAINYCNDVINSSEYSLLDDYESVFDVNNENNEEEIWSIMFTRDGTASAQGSIGSDAVNLFSPNNIDLNTMPDPLWGTGLGFFNVEQWAYDRYTTGDYVTDDRNKLFVTTYLNQANKPQKRYPLVKTGVGPAYIKYKDMQELDSRNAENNLYILRYADILLMKAEALNESDQPGAEVLVNEVRERAHNETPVASGLSKEEFRYEIFEERGIEFMGECQRWFDMIRMKRNDGTTYYDYIKQKAIDDAIYTHAAQNVWALSYNTKMQLMPIPFDEINSNPKIGPEDQNPGY